MNINRLLSRRDKSGEHRRSKSTDATKKDISKKPRPLSADILLLFKNDPVAKLERDEAKAEAKKVAILRKRLEEVHLNFKDTELEYALRTAYANGDVDRAYEIVILFRESEEGIVKPYNPDIHMQGAENRNAVTCYLDALLFAMFARLGSFEPILRNTFDDEPRRRLATLIRLWVNMLRTGKLIHTDITKVLQDTLAECGWEDAAEIQQQDTSEAFGFITEQLELPLLTLKMDIYHTGAEVAADDHKIIHERLLEVAVPLDPGEGKVIQLEDCLEEYFNNRIEVVRRLERTNTMTSEKRSQSPFDETPPTQHLEHAEPSWSAPSSPLVPTPTTESPSAIESPQFLRRRATSIIRRRVIESSDEEPKEGSGGIGDHSRRKGSLRKEVLMPAWQFFSLIPWYTEAVPTTDAQVAAHFSSTRPVLGICLKRYTMTATGASTRRDTFIDIPLQIALPHFIQDERRAEDGPMFGNFKLVLQSVVCHRGTSVHAGHYISLVRSEVQSYEDDPLLSRRNSSSSGLPRYSEDKWIMFDDLAPQRVKYVDIGEALKREMPYLLFYQVQPMFDVSPTTTNEPEPPAYSDTETTALSEVSTEVLDPLLSQEPSYFDRETEEQRERTSMSDTEQPRFSLNLTGVDGRESFTLTDMNIGSVSTAPPTPSEDATSNRPSRATSRFTLSSSRSRPNSQYGENRIRDTIQRLTMRKSKDSINKPLVEALASSLGSNASDISSGISLPNGPIPEPTGADTNGRPSFDETGITTTYTAPAALAPTPKKKGKEKDTHLHAHKHRGEKDDPPDRECTIM